MSWFAVRRLGVAVLLVVAGTQLVGDTRPSTRRQPANDTAGPRAGKETATSPTAPRAALEPDIHVSPNALGCRSASLTGQHMSATATQTGDLDGLEAMLAHDVSLHGDGGGKVRALTHPLFGRRRVARTMLSWMQNVVGGIEGFSIRPVEVNGRPGALGLDGQQRVLYVLSLDIANGQIQGIHSIANPDKLRHLGPLSDLPTPLSPGPSSE